MDTIGEEAKTGFCIFINTLCQGAIPVERDCSTSLPVVYPTREAAEKEIARDVIDRLEDFLEGEREFDDAINPEEYVVKVTVLSDGSVVDEAGFRFGKEYWHEGG